MSPTLTKILVGIGVVITLGMLGLILYQQHELKTQQTAIQTSLTAQQQLIDGIVRSSSQYATAADLQNFANQNGLNLQAIQDNLKQLNSQLAAINVISTDSTPQSGNNLPSSGQGPANPTPPPSNTVACTPGGTVTCPNGDPFGYQKAQQQFTLNEDFGTLKVPFGTVGFSAWQQNPWSVTIPQREYDVDTVVGVDENEKQTFYNKFTMKVSGQSYDIPITNATTKQQVPTASWSWWNPRLLMGVDGGFNINHVQGELTPSINLGIMSYGQYKTTPDFSILEVGFGYGTINKTGEVVLTPVAYNIGKKLFSPLVNNTYIGPSVQIGTDGSLGVGAGLRVGF
jgi:hypothetical protein